MLMMRLIELRDKRKAIKLAHDITGFVSYSIRWSQFVGFANSHCKQKLLFYAIYVQFMSQK